MQVVALWVTDLQWACVHLTPPRTTAIHAEGSWEEPSKFQNSGTGQGPAPHAHVHRPWALT